MVLEAQSQAQSTWVVDPVHSAIEFSVRHMMVTTVRGRFTKYDAKINLDEAHPEGSSVEAQIDASSIDTREPQRDNHLRSPDFLDVEKFPQITFKSKRIAPKGQDRYLVYGDLTIRDVTQEIALDTTFAGFVNAPRGDRRAGFAAEATINRKDFGANWNVALEAGGVLVGDSVKINIELELIKQEERT